MLTLLTLYSCLISKRGKGAKGTVAVKTYGKPEVNKKGNTTKDWDYTFCAKMPLAETIAELQTAHDDNVIVEGLLRGLDLFNKSEAIQSGSATAILAKRVLDEGLAIDAKDAKNYALKVIQNMNFAANSGMPTFTIEQYLENRRAQVAKLKADGLWRVDESDDESDDDSEDSDE